MKIEIDGKPVITKDDKIISLATAQLKFFIKTIKSKKQIRPTFNVFDGEIMHVYVTQWSNWIEKRHFVNFLHDECQRLSAHYVIAVSDIWISTKIVDTWTEDRSKKMIDNHAEVLPSEDPNRTEAIIVILTYPDGRLDSIIAPYERSPSGYPVFDENPRWSEYEKASLGLIMPWVNKYS